MQGILPTWLLSSLLVAFGGSIGCLVRFALSVWQRQWSFTHHFPIATTIANLIGSAFIGYLAARSDSRHDPTYLLLAVGFCGGLTTFSTLALELTTHLQNNRFASFLLEIGLNFGLGLLVCYLAFVYAAPQKS